MKRSFVALAVASAIAASQVRAMDMDASEMTETTPVGTTSFRADFCPPATDDCGDYISFVYKNTSDLAWSLSDDLVSAVGEAAEVSIVDAAQDDKVLAVLDGTAGTLAIAEDGDMEMTELAGHFCMGHIFAEYEGELYRIDPTTAGEKNCGALMGGSTMDMGGDHGGDHGSAMDAMAPTASGDLAMVNLGAVGVLPLLLSLVFAP
jgi:hypothetical protein